MHTSRSLFPSVSTLNRGPTRGELVIFTSINQIKPRISDKLIKGDTLNAYQVTSVSSCTSSIVGHGSAICARGIFAEFSFPSSVDQIPSPEFFIFFIWCSSYQELLAGILPLSGPKCSWRRTISTPLGGDGGAAHEELSKQL